MRVVFLVHGVHGFIWGGGGGHTMLSHTPGLYNFYFGILLITFDRETWICF